MVCTQNSYTLFNKFINSKLPKPAQTSPNQPKYQILLHKKTPALVFSEVTLCDNTHKTSISYAYVTPL